MSKKQQIPLVLKRTKHSLVLSVLALILIVVGSCSKDDEVVQFKLATTVSPAEGGSISTTGGNFESGKEVTLTATPSQGYTFKNWSGAIKGDQNPIKVVFNADKSISANFEKMDADADGVPDLSLGRMPVDSTDELAALVQRIIDYESKPGDAWQTRMNFIAGVGGFGQIVDNVVEEVAKKIITGGITDENGIFKVKN